MTAQCCAYFQGTNDGRSSLTVVLAAGEGTRMRSALPKVLHPVAGGAAGHVLAAAPDGAGRRSPS